MRPTDRRCGKNKITFYLTDFRRNEFMDVCYRLLCNVQNIPEIGLANSPALADEQRMKSIILT